MQPSTTAEPADTSGSDRAWKTLADRANHAATFHPATSPDSPPCVEVAGVIGFLYVDPTRRAVACSLHLDAGVAEWLCRDNPDRTVPLRVMVNDDVVFDDTDPATADTRAAGPKQAGDHRDHRPSAVGDDRRHLVQD